MSFYNLFDCAYQVTPDNDHRHPDDAWHPDQQMLDPPTSYPTAVVESPIAQLSVPHIEDGFFRAREDSVVTDQGLRLNFDTAKYPQHQAWVYAMSPNRFPSPSDSSLTSAYSHSNWSDSQSPPWTSPGIPVPPAAYGPCSSPGDGIDYAYAAEVPYEGVQYAANDSFVAPREVQHYADAPADITPIDDDQPPPFAIYGPYAQSVHEGYHTSDCNSPAHEVTPYHTAAATPERASSAFFSSAADRELPNLRHRRPKPPHRGIGASSTVGKVGKRPSGARRASSGAAAKTSGKYRHGGNADDEKGSNSTGNNNNNNNRAFPCPFTIYGCTSTFSNKNEWKRHVNTQHMRLGFWRCDQCIGENGSKRNDFNRKDLFIQHVRRMHPNASVAAVVDKEEKKQQQQQQQQQQQGRKQDDEKQSMQSTARATTNTTTAAGTKQKAAPSSTQQPSGNTPNRSDEQALTRAAKRCYRHLRSPPPRTSCLFCDKVFVGSSTWDERMEHVGHHMETTKKKGEAAVDPADWRDDPAMTDWLIHESLIIWSGSQENGWVLPDAKQ